MTKLEAIKQRLAAATSGPWKFLNTVPHRAYIVGVDDPRAHGVRTIAEVPRQEDLFFIAHAREDMELLLRFAYRIKAIREAYGDDPHEYLDEIDAASAALDAEES